MTLKELLIEQYCYMLGNVSIITMAMLRAHGLVDEAKAELKRCQGIIQHTNNN